MSLDLIKILLVDDDKDDFVITRDLLLEVTSRRFELDWASSYLCALDIIRQKNYEVCLFDYRLGEHTGLDLLREIRKNGFHMPVILLTGQGDHEIDIEAMKAGASDYLIKGEINTHLLEKSIRYAIERKNSEKQILRLAYYDNLTALPNRLLFNDRLKQAIILAKRYNRILGILFLDLDNFKHINDTFGHRLGDELLQQVSERLTSSIRSSDTISRPNLTSEDTTFTLARLGGDEFIILLSEISTSSDAATVAQRIISLFSKPFHLESHEVFVGVSIGIALFPIDGQDTDCLLKNADTAMYQAKYQGKNTYRFYKESMNAATYQKITFQSQLWKAFEREEFIIFYQPQMNMLTGEIVGSEALIRWQNPEGGLIYPADFIPLAEETGIIVPIGEWVMRHACENTLDLQKSGFGSLRVSVNISKQQFSEPHFLDTIKNVLSETGLSPQFLELEITESIFMKNTDDMIHLLRKLKELGVGLSMDDFGIGFSSFSYLKDTQLDAVKIDRSFLKDIPTNSKDKTIVTAIIAMAHALNMRVIAEGVETVEQLNFLTLKQCNEMQGYLLSKPIPFHEFKTFLMNRYKH